MELHSAFCRIPAKFAASSTCLKLLQIIAMETIYKIYYNIINYVSIGNNVNIGN